MDAALKRLARYESEISSFLGVVVVLAIVGLIIFLLRGNKNQPSISELGTQTSTEETSASSTLPTTYTVTQGQGLWQVAQEVYKDGNKWNEIAKANNLQAPYMLTTGQKLTIPAIAQAQEAPAAVVKPTPVAVESVQPKIGEYVVKKGDNLWKIALEQYGGNGYAWVKIYQANKALVVKNPGLIYEGQKLSLPEVK